MNIKAGSDIGPITNNRKSGRKLIYFLLSLLTAILLTVILRDHSFNDSQDYVLFLLFFAVGLWLTEAIPAFAVGLFIMAFLIFSLGNPRFNSNPQNIAKYVQTFSNSIIWLMLGGFFLAEAMTKTGIDTMLFRFAVRISGQHPRRILLGLMLMTMAASMILSNTATTSMVIASVMPLLNRLGKKPFAIALLTGIPLAASVGGMGTIIGSPTNAIAAGVLENKGLSISFLQWTFAGIPLALILTFAGWWLLTKKYVQEGQPLDLDFTNAPKIMDAAVAKDRRIVMIIFLVTVLLWLTSSLHHLTVAAVAIVPIVFLTMTGILQAADMRKLPWDTLLLVAGGLSLGLALQETGLLEHYARGLTQKPMPTLALYLIFAYGTMLFSNIMSNTATTTILVPLGIYLMPDHALEVAVIIGLAASTALLLPVSTPPNAIAFSTGLIRQKDFIPAGLLIGLLGPALITLLVLLLL